LKSRCGRHSESGRFESTDDLPTQALRALHENPRAVPPNRLPAHLRKTSPSFCLDSPLRGSGLKVERQKDHPTASGRVRLWFEGVDPDSLFASVVTLGEILGILGQWTKSGHIGS